MINNLQTPKQRLILTTILRVVENKREADFLRSCMQFRRLSEAQRNILNKCYNKYKDLMYV
tara:strand:+ start:922 stop:1104 length:183 start_codon:yes stop_codon:yes gene_type:complete